MYLESYANGDQAIKENVLNAEGYLAREKYGELIAKPDLTQLESVFLQTPHPRIAAIMNRTRETDKAYFEQQRNEYCLRRPYVEGEQWPELPLTGCTEVMVELLPKDYPGGYPPDRRVTPLDGTPRKSWVQHDPFDNAAYVRSGSPRQPNHPDELKRRHANAKLQVGYTLVEGRHENGVVLSSVQPERIKWLWEGRIPYGKLTVLDGDPGLGKSTVTMDLAARLSEGRPLPDGTPTDAAGVVLLTAEDGLADTIVPRLNAARADLNKILALTIKDEHGDRLLSLPGDLPHLREAIERMGAGLVIIDPLMAFLGGNVNSFKDQDIRLALAPLMMMAEQTGAAIVIVRHLNKSNTGPALYRGGGSIGIIGAARSGLLVAADPDDPARRILAPTKSNLGALAPSLAFSLREAPNGVAAVTWEGHSSHTAASLLAASGNNEEDKSALEEAKTFLKESLAEGGQWVKQLIMEARQQGISDRTLKRAKAFLGIKSYRVGTGAEGGWKWTIHGKD
jgi:hypothetical protein